MGAAVALSVGLLAHAADAEVEAVQSAPQTGQIAADAERFRDEIEAYVREHGRQLREALNEELRRELAGKVVLAMNELRARG